MLTRNGMKIVPPRGDKKKYLSKLIKSHPVTTGRSEAASKAMSDMADDRSNPGFGPVAEQRPLADFVAREAGREMDGWNCSTIPWRGGASEGIDAPSRHGTEWHCHTDPRCTKGYRGVQGCRSFGQ